MSAVMIDRGTVAASTRREEPTPAENPRTRRYAINPGLASLEVQPRLSGRQLALVPYGFALRFDTFVGMSMRNWSVDAEDKSPPVVEGDLTAKEALSNVAAHAWESSRDMGFRELSALTPLADDEAEALLALVFPALDPAATKCPYAFENTTELEDGTEVFRCVACTLEWLESDGCEALAAADSAAAVALRRQLLDAYRTTDKFFQVKWAEWTGEMQKRERGENGLAKLEDGHLHVMRQLHEILPSDRQAALITESQKTQATAIREGMKEGMKELAEGLKPQQPAVDTDALLAKMKADILSDPEVRAALLADLKKGEKPAKEK